MISDRPSDREAPDVGDPLGPDRPRWWGTTPAVTPRPRWAGWAPRRGDWAAIFEPDHADPAGPWRLAAVWLLGAPLGAFVAAFVLLVVCMRGRIEPVWSLMRWWENAGPEWAVLLPCAVPAAAVGGAWLLRRGRGERFAQRAALAYAAAVGWLYVCGAATASLLRGL